MLARATRRSLQRGLTLIELMVVVAIIAVSATLAAPGIAAMSANYKVRSTAESILNGLNYARTEAVRRNAPVTFTLGTASAWTVSQASPSATLQSRSSADGAGTTVTSAGGATAVTFLPTGLIQAGAQLRQVTVASVVPDANSRRIDIFGGGLIRMCDPQLSVSGDPRRC